MYTDKKPYIVMSIKIYNKMKAVGYTRVSTEEQAKEGISLANQTECIKALCVAKGWELMEIICDEGKSAKDLNRNGIQKLMANVKAGKFDILVVYRLDRLTRSVRDLGYIVQDVLEKHNVALSSIQDSFDTSTASGKLILNVLGSIAQWEREIIGERTRDGLRYKKSRLEHYGPIPYGFELDGTKLQPKKDELTVVAYIHNLRHKLKYPYKTIADTLNAEGLMARNGKKWHASCVRVIANNDVYLQHPAFCP
jgi:DNA invertase Pin-like site-specific DNA recombinase